MTLTAKGWKTVVPLTNELAQTSADAIRGLVAAWQTRRRERDLPVEDELCVILHWLGQCTLVHRLRESAYPLGASQQFSIPALFAAFKVNGTDIPVLIDVADRPSGGVPLWERGYLDALRYADLLNIPLLIALKYLNFWTLFEARHLQAAGDKLTILPTAAMSETLLGALAGDFSFSFRPGVGMHLKIRKGKRTTDGGFDGLIEEAYLLNDKGERHTGAGGLFQLFACMEQEVYFQEDETHAVQSFIVPTSDQAEFSHRALATLLRTFGEEEPLDWHQILIREQLPLLFMSPHEAVRTGLEAGFIQHKITIWPKTMPAFLSGKVKGS